MKRIHMSTPISVLALALFDSQRWGVCLATRVAQISCFLPCRPRRVDSPASLLFAGFYIFHVGVAECNLLHFWLRFEWRKLVFVIVGPSQIFALVPRVPPETLIHPQFVRNCWPASGLCLARIFACLVFGQQFNAQSMFDQRKLSFN